MVVPDAVAVAAKVAQRATAAQHAGEVRVSDRYMMQLQQQAQHAAEVHVDGKNLVQSLAFSCSFVWVTKETPSPQEVPAVIAAKGTAGDSGE